MKIKEAMMEEQMERAEQEQEYQLDLHQRTYEVLAKIKPTLTAEDFALMCYHCGYSATNDFQ
jgi:hypothetical protein